jgi:hypothetical protein
MVPSCARGLTVPSELGVVTNGVEPVDLAVEFTRVVPLSGNLCVCGQQFWLGPDRAGATVTFWADTTVVHLLTNDVRLKTVPSGIRTPPERPPHPAFAAGFSGLALGRRRRRHRHRGRGRGRGR